MIWAILVIGEPSKEILNYLRKTNARFMISRTEISPFEAHAAYPGFDYLIYWHACVVPTPALPTLDTLFDFSKINVSWDSYGRNYPHKTSQRYSLDFIGLPHSPAGAAQITNYSMLETQDLYILPKNLNVCEGYAEFATALLKNMRKRVPEIPSFVKRYDARLGRYV
jgi:hypothetical protein